MTDETICGCKKKMYDTELRHLAVCVERGWSKMASKEEVEADKRKYKLEELQEEADEEVGKIRNKAEEYAVIARAGINMVKAVRPSMPLKEVAAEVRDIFASDLRPFVDMIQDAEKFLVETGANMRADTVVAMMNRTGLSEEACVALVLGTDQKLTKAIKNAELGSKDKKK